MARNAILWRIVLLKTYVFQAELEQDGEDGRWSARVKSLPGCGVWGYTREEALQALQPAAKMFIEVMLEAGDELPTEGVSVIEAPVVTVSL